MLKRLHRRMVLLAIVAFFLVITLVAVLVNLINYRVVTERLDHTIGFILRFEEASPSAPPPGPFMELPNKEDNYMTRFFSVRYDEAGELVAVSTNYIAEVDETQALEYADRVRNLKTDSGYIGNYRFAVSEIDGYKIITFLNVARDQDAMKSLLILSVSVALGSLILVSVIVILLSKRAIKPFAANIESQKQFITNASHELKTPLTSISTSMDVIALEHGEDEWIANVKKQAQRMSKLVNELVVLSRLDEATPFQNKESFSLSDTAWEMVEVCQQEAKAQQKELSVNIQDNVFMVGEKSAIQKMLSVLLENAIRYSDPQTAIRFDVLKKKNKIYIETFNSCKFETPPDIKRLFDRFYRPDISRSTDTGGTGIGLAVAKAVAEKHGGDISAECPDNKSILFRVIL